MKKYWICLLIFIVALFVSCADTPSVDSTDVTSDVTTTAAEVLPEPTYLDIVKDGASDYKIVFSRSGDTLPRTATMTLTALIRSLTGVSLSPMSDDESSAKRQGREIVIGKTTREDEYTVDYDNLAGDAYVIKVVDERLVFVAASEAGYDAAFAYFFENVLGVEDMENMERQDTLSLPDDLDIYAPPSLMLDDGKTASGDAYTVDGADEVKLNYCTFGSTVTYTLDTPVGKGFNAYSLAYCSNVPVTALVRYKLHGELYEETVYLEAGNHQKFTSLIDGYLTGSMGDGIYEICVSHIKAKTGTFRLEDVTTEARDVPTDDVAYITDGKYKLGVMLTWGGGISYLEDLADGDDSITNLLNRHDTGRLVQQSYYGTNTSPYVCGTYSGQKWGYNPVQGGDQHNNRSKLIDYCVSDDELSIYVKCQPLDWAKNGEHTPSYMENTYTLADGYIEVDNRFVDFSGYTHRQAHQELPAFYTISYLSEFVFYQGSSGWTGGELRVERDLPFWAGNSNAYFKLKSEETWGAWVSPDGYGVGVYTPIAEQLLAGRHQYNGSKSATNGATNYVAPLITYTLKTFEPFEYSYYITTGSVDAIRDTFTSIATAE